MILKYIKLSGTECPVHFGLYALKQISEKLKIDFADFMAGINIAEIQKQVTIATIGLNEGSRRGQLGISYEEIEVYDLLDDNPEVLDQIMSIYFEQSYGKRLEAFILEYNKQAKLEKNGKRRTEIQATVASLKTAWKEIQATAKELPSKDFSKQA